MRVSCDKNRIGCDGGFSLDLSHLPENLTGPNKLPLVQLSPVEGGACSATVQVDALISNGHLLLHLGVPPEKKSGPSGLIGALISVDGRNIVDGEIGSETSLLIKGGDEAKLILPLSRIKELQSDDPRSENIDLSVRFSRMKKLAETIDPVSLEHTSEFGVGFSGIQGADLAPLGTVPPYNIHLKLYLDSQERVIGEIVRKVIEQMGKPAQ